MNVSKEKLERCHHHDESKLALKLWLSLKYSSCYSYSLFRISLKIHGSIKKFNNKSPLSRFAQCTLTHICFHICYVVQFIDPWITPSQTLSSRIFAVGICQYKCALDLFEFWLWLAIERVPFHSIKKHRKCL